MKLAYSEDSDASSEACIRASHQVWNSAKI
jgi:hypothetical protein